jgi:hypothetical protein
VTEELKRKIRIAAGGIQSVVRLWPLLNIFRYGILSFQYISHRVLRWTITPLLLPVVLILNILLFNSGLVYQVLLICQIMFYLFSFLGWFSEKTGMRKIKPFFVPYYFLIMNYAVYMGFFRYMKKSQSVNWERAKRG